MLEIFSKNHPSLRVQAVLADALYGNIAAAEVSPIQQGTPLQVGIPGDLAPSLQNASITSFRQ